MSVSIVLGFSAVLVLCVLVRRYGRFLYLTCNVPGPPLWEFVLVHAKELLSDNLIYHTEKLCMAYKYRPWGMWSMCGFMVIVSDCDSIGEVFKSKNFYNKTSFFYEPLSFYMGRGLVTLNGEKHKQHKKMLAPAFRKTHVDTHLPQINILAEHLAERLRQVAHGEDVYTRDMVREHVGAMSVEFFAKDHFPTAEVVRMLRVVEYALTDVMVESFNPVYYYLWHRLTPAARARAKSVRWAMDGKYRVYFEARDRLLASCDRQSVAVEKRKRKKTTCVLDLLVEEHLIRGEDSSFDEEATSEIVTILGASQDTTTFTMSMCLVLIALHPEVQRRICEEVDGIFGGSVRPVEHEDLVRLKYLEMAIKETLRIFPPVPSIAREAEEEVVLDGVTVPKGCIIIINFLALHRNPAIFKDPLKYDPLRFSPELSEGRNSNAYVPFSAGPRGCPGQLFAWRMLKTSLCYIFREFQVFPGTGVNYNAIDDIKPPLAVTLDCPKFPLRFVRRIK